MTNLTENWKANFKYFVVNIWRHKLFRGNTNIYVWLISQYWNNTSRFNPSSVTPETHMIWLTLTGLAADGLVLHDDVIKLKHFPRYWPFVRGIHRSPVNSPRKGQWRRASMFSLICAWINGWVNTPEASDLGRHRAHYDVILMARSWESISHAKSSPKSDQHFGSTLLQYLLLNSCYLSEWSR